MTIIRKNVNNTDFTNVLLSRSRFTICI